MAALCMHRSAAGLTTPPAVCLLPLPAAGALLSQLHLGRVSVERGSAVVHIAGEVLPRHVTQFELVGVLGPGYRTLDLALEADAAPRHPGSSKITLINPAARRHLRHVTPGCPPHRQDKLYTGDVGPRPWLLPPAVQEEEVVSPPRAHAAEAAAAQDAATREDAGSSSDSFTLPQPGSTAAQQQQPVSSSTEAGVEDNAATSKSALSTEGTEQPTALALPDGPICMRLGGGQVPATIHYQAPTSPALVDLPDSSSTSLACPGGCRRGAAGGPVQLCNVYTQARCRIYAGIQHGQWCSKHWAVSANRWQSYMQPICAITNLCRAPDILDRL
jgi:hypothetical protein